MSPYVSLRILCFCNTRDSTFNLFANYKNCHFTQIKDIFIFYLKSTLITIFFTGIKISILILLFGSLVVRNTRNNY